MWYAIALELTPELMTEWHKRELVEYNEWKQQSDLRDRLDAELWRAMNGNRQPWP